MAKIFKVRKEIFIDYAHHIQDYPGACMNIHGHTWCWQVSLQAEELNELGMVLDFSAIKKHILMPVHNLFDHALVLNDVEFLKTSANFAHIGRAFGADRLCKFEEEQGFSRGGLTLQYVGGLKIVTLSFVPTCETLTGWFFDFVKEKLELLGYYPRVKVASVCIYEQMHPTTSCCTVTSN